MIPRLIGMVHLGPLPGAPEPGPIADVVQRARSDAEALAEAGFDALMVENFGDAPFFGDDAPKVTVAAMTRAASEVAQVGLPFGVNVLRNDGMAALAVAAASGASFIRVNVLSGVMHTDQGTITGRAAEIARERARIAPGVAVLADVFVKHATPPPGLTLEQAALDLWERGGADGVVVSGPGTGSAIEPRVLKEVAAAIPDAPLIAGSGVAADTVATLLQTCRSVIVGTSIKQGGVTTAPVDPTRARQLVEAAS